jgi:hypothetical protein
MAVPPDITQAIHARLRDLAGSAAAATDPRAFAAARLGALPVWLDAGGGYAIRPDGAVLCFLWDDLEARSPAPAKLEDDARRIRFAYYRASLTYPELAPLVASRPPDAPPCHFCEGTGQVRLPDGTVLDVVCHCGGQGW